MSKEIVLSGSARLALFIVEKALSVLLDKEIMLKDCTILLHEPWAHKFENGAQIREGRITGNLWLKEGEKPEPVDAVVSLFCFDDGRPAMISGNQQVIRIPTSGILVYANWQENGAIRVGDANISPIPWFYTPDYVKGSLDR
ncbi:MAG TPA: hypothetical protein VHD55_00305 [Candidatus Paceibacterota bacterium]|nr:hypothetical protein [Candidatus Paceibacterota bacterium]